MFLLELPNLIHPLEYGRNIRFIDVLLVVTVFGGGVLALAADAPHLSFSVECWVSILGVICSRLASVVATEIVGDASLGCSLICHIRACGGLPVHADARVGQLRLDVRHQVVNKVIIIVVIHAKIVGQLVDIAIVVDQDVLDSLRRLQGNLCQQTGVCYRVPLLAGAHGVLAGGDRRGH